MSQYMNELTDGILKIRDSSLAGVADWIECCPVHQRVTSLIPSQGTCLGFGPGPQLEVCRGTWSMYLSHIDVSLYFSLSSSL